MAHTFTKNFNGVCAESTMHHFSIRWKTLESCMLLLFTEVAKVVCHKFSAREKNPHLFFAAGARARKKAEGERQGEAEEAHAASEHRVDCHLIKAGHVLCHGGLKNRCLNSEDGASRLPGGCRSRKLVYELAGRRLNEKIRSDFYTLVRILLARCVAPVICFSPQRRPFLNRRPVNFHGMLNFDKI